MKKLIYLFPLLIVFLFQGCGDEVDSPASGSAKVNFYLVDAPGDFEEVWIEILAIRVLMNDAAEDDESEWIEVPYNENDRYVNLLTLVGEKSEFLGTEDLPEGEIKQIRLVLGDDNFVVIDGERSDLKTPSAQQSGLKIKVDEPVQSGQVYGLVIDFDVEKSIVVAGNSGNIILKPVLRAYMEESATGVMGQVLPVEAQPIGVKMVGAGEEYNTQVDDDGNFKILGVEDGLYSLEISPNNTYKALTIENVAVENGKIKVIDPIVLEVN
ncbi:DUF4382 domain-containing protein [Algoriphagus namhaensis]|uniref:DUF4382 domain-containing protein n=1 Tax=Algoriphagus namhaensis TaxID=915353 RepID=A0ABV8APT1_9BACT